MSFFALMAVFASCKKNEEPRDPKKILKNVSDKDYFITEWEGKEIRIDKIFGENTIAQYRVKGAKDWEDIKISNNSLLIENLDNTKTYELRLFNVDRIITSLSENPNISLKLITQWGTNEWIDMNRAFSYCINLDVTARDIPNLGKCENCRYMFARCENLKGNAMFKKWDVSNVKNMSYMFWWASSFNQDISGWDVTNVTDMSSMFAWATSFNQPIGDWNVSNVTDMSNMFDFATSFNQPISDWNVSNVTNMSNMFNKATSFNQDISKWNVGNVTDMSYMFYDADSFNQPLNNWNVSNVTNMSYMFGGATSFNQPLNDWNVSNVTNMNDMFSYADSFNQDISGWNVANVTDMSYMFYRAHSFKQDLSGWDVRNVVKWENISNGDRMPREYMPAKFR